MRDHKEGHVLEENRCDPFSAEKIFGVSALGAIAALGLYFLYQNLSDENKRTVKESLVSGFRAAIHI